MSHTIRDNVHGNILFSDLEKQVLDHPLFLRLRNISQLGFLRFVFPCSTHTRFEHSLGVMHLCDKFLKSLIQNQERILPRLYHEDHQNHQIIRYLEQLKKPITRTTLRLAALIHDLGHGPFSHASECITRNLKPMDFLDLDLPHWLAEVIEKKIKNNKPVTHEWLTARYACDLIEPKGPLSENQVRDVLAILDEEIVCAENSAIKEIRPLLHDILSGEVDADRMDYLLRDSKNVGVNYGLFDIERLMENFCFTIKEDSPRLSIYEPGIEAFEDYLFSRYQMYTQIYMNKTNSTMEAMLQKANHLATGLKPPLGTQDFLAYTDATFIPWLEKQIAQEDNQSIILEIIYDLLLHRKLWKPVFLEKSYGDTDQANQTLFEKIQYKAKKIGLENAIAPYESTRALSRYRPQTSELRQMSILTRQFLNRDLVMKPVYSVSYVLSSFQKTIHHKRIFVHPSQKDFLEEHLRQL